nr:MAG TPA: Nodulin-21-like protein [Caudoviricetes sp.]
MNIMVDYLKSVISNDEWLMTVILFAVSLAGVLSATLSTYKSKQKIDLQMIKHEAYEVDKAIQSINMLYKDTSEGKGKKTDDKNVLNMMMDNVSELREYYVISKQQARRSFSAALFICFLGIFIYLLGIIAYIVLDKNISIISVISGTVVEVIAGLFFWLYREATKQLGVYHQRLGSTEKYLTVMQIIREMPEDKRVEAFQNLTMAILTDNREIISHEK